jgi:hypothetical protein
MADGRRALLATLATIGLIAVGARPVPQEAPPASRPAGAPQTREAVAAGLRFLALAQNPAGFWLGDVGGKEGGGYAISFDRARQEAEDRGNAGSTALAGLAFLAAGHLPGRGPHGRTLDRAVDYVVHGTSRHDGPKGYISDCGTRMYEHAFATLFLSQVLGMAQVKTGAIPARLSAAVDLIVDCQAEEGGWRYLPYAKDCDLSVTVCQLQALRAARDAGVRVSSSCIERAVAYVQKSYDAAAGSFTYQLETGRRSYRGSFCIDAAAVTSLQSAGIYAGDPIARALDGMEKGYEAISRDHPTHYFFWYGNYYAAQAFHHAGGDRWQRFSNRLFTDLLARQQKDGRWRNDVGPGDEFATATACLMLSVPDGLLPIFQK